MTALDRDTAAAHALPGTEAGTRHGKPAVKANGHALIGPGREPGSFVLHLREETKLLRLETDPAHMLAMIEVVREQTMQRRPPRKR